MTVRDADDSIRLADEADFPLGPLLVRPSASCVEGPGGRTRIEPRVMAVLLVLARARGQTVSRDALIQMCWGGRVVTDNAVSRTLSPLRALARRHADAFQIETLPKIGFRLLVEDDDGDAEPAPIPRRADKPVFWAALLALGILVFSASLFAWSRSRIEPAWISVDTVRGADGGAEVRLMVAALADGLVNALAAGGAEVTPGAARPEASRLGLTASVAREDDADVIRVRLVSHRSGAVMWSRRFDRPFTSHSGFADVTAAQIGATVGCARRNASRYRGRMPDETLALLLQVCAAQADDDAPAMVAATAKLVGAAPRFARAHALQALANISASWQAGDAALTQAALVRARAAAQRALALSPDEPDAHAALGMDTDLSLSEREEHFRQAMKTEPNSLSANTLYVWFLQEVGRVREAAALAATTAAHYPLSASVQERAGWLAAVGGDRPASDLFLRRLDLIDPRKAEDVRLRLGLWLDPPTRALQTLREVLSR